MIIDEAQDLTLVGIRFARALVDGKSTENLRADSILMLDDAAQRIYPGGFRPHWANLDFAGNSHTLTTNYRNTKSIFLAAREVRGETIVSKGANDDGVVEALSFEADEGLRPVLLVSKRQEAPVIREKIRELIDEHGFDPSEIGVLAMRNRHIAALLKYLRGKQVPCVNLKDLKSEPLGDGIRIGTFDRAKGMEFRAVIIPRLGESRFPIDTHDPERDHQSLSLSLSLPNADDHSPEEERQLNLDRLYVAMTRAKERLYLVADERPCAEIENAEGYLDEHPTH